MSFLLSVPVHSPKKVEKSQEQKKRRKKGENPNVNNNPKSAIHREPSAYAYGGIDMV